MAGLWLEMKKKVQVLVFKNFDVTNNCEVRQVFDIQVIQVIPKDRVKSKHSSLAKLTLVTCYTLTRLLIVMLPINAKELKFFPTFA